MQVAYLVNQYPTPTHTFIRRELRAIEAQGFRVLRVTIRTPDVELPDPIDREERSRTRSILGRGVAAVLLDTLALAIRRPVRWMRTLATAVRLGWRSQRGLVGHLAYFCEACSVTRLVEPERIQHIHVHFGTNAAMVALLVRRLGGPPYSMMVHGPDEFDSPERSHLREKVADAAFVTAISDFARSQILRWSSTDCWDKVHVVRCGLDGNFLDGSTASVPSAPLLVCIARLSPSKGHVILLRALAILRGEGIDMGVQLLGGGPMSDELRRMSAGLGLGDVVDFRGWVDEDTIRRALFECRALVLPSFGEGLPVVIMEAFAMGRPVVCSTIAGIPELVENTVNGWLVAPGNVDSLAKALREVLSASSERLTAMGLRGRDATVRMHDVRTESRKLAVLMRGSASTD